MGGTAALVLAAACASGGGDGATQDPPTLRGTYRLDVTLRAGQTVQDVRGLLDFEDGEWVTWTPLEGDRRRVGPCRYHARGGRVQVRCGVEAWITGTAEGLHAQVADEVVETYWTEECAAWTTDAEGQQVCAAYRPVERSRTVTAWGEAYLSREGGG